MPPKQNQKPVAAPKATTPTAAPAPKPAAKPKNPRLESVKKINTFLGGKATLDQTDWSKINGGFIGTINSWIKDTDSYSAEFRAKAKQLRDEIKKNKDAMSDSADTFTPEKIKQFTKNLEAKQKDLENAAAFDTHQKSLNEHKTNLEKRKADLTKLFEKSALDKFAQSHLKIKVSPPAAQKAIEDLIAAAIAEAQPEVNQKIADLLKNVAKGKTLKQKDLTKLVGIDTEITNKIASLPKTLKEAIEQSPATSLKLKKIADFLDSQIFIKNIPKDSPLCIQAYKKSIQDFKEGKLDVTKSVDAILWGRVTDVVNAKLKQKLDINEVRVSVRYYELGKYKNATEKGKSKKIIEAIMASKSQLEKEGIVFNFMGGTDATDHDINLVNKQSLTWHQEKAASLKGLQAMLAARRVVPNITLTARQNTAIELYLTAVSTGQLNKIKLAVSSYKQDLLAGKGIFDLALSYQRAQDFKRRLHKDQKQTLNTKDLLFLHIGSKVKEQSQRKSGLELSVVPVLTSKRDSKTTIDPIEATFKLLADHPETAKLQKKLPKNLRGKGFFVDLVGMIRRKDKEMDKYTYTLVPGGAILKHQEKHPDLFLEPGKNPDKDFVDYEKYKIEETEKYLPKNLHGKNFYTDPEGKLRRHKKKGYYQLRPDGSLIGIIKDKKYILAPDKDPDKKDNWKSLEKPKPKLPKKLSVNDKFKVKETADSTLIEAQKALSKSKASADKIAAAKNKIDGEIRNLKANNLIPAESKKKALTVLESKSKEQSTELQAARNEISKNRKALTNAKRAAEIANKKYQAAKRRADFLDSFTPKFDKAYNELEKARQDLHTAITKNDTKGITAAATKLTAATKTLQELIKEEATHLAEEKSKTDDATEQNEINEDAKVIFESQLRSLAASHKLKSNTFIVWSDEEYDYPEMLQDLPNLINAFNLLAQKGYLEFLNRAKTTVALNPSSWNLIKEGYHEDASAIALDITETPQGIYSDFVSAHLKIRQENPDLFKPKPKPKPTTKPKPKPTTKPKPKPAEPAKSATPTTPSKPKEAAEKKTDFRTELKNAIAPKIKPYGFHDVAFTSDEDYEVNEIKTKHIKNLEKALSLLTPADKKFLDRFKVPLALNDQSVQGRYYDTDGQITLPDGTGAIAIDITEDAAEIAEDLKEGIQDLKESYGYRVIELPDGTKKMGYLDSKTGWMTEGRVEYANGAIKEGKFNPKNERMLEGKITYKSGTHEEGKFEDGRLVKGLRRSRNGIELRGTFDPSTGKLINGQAINLRTKQARKVANGKFETPEKRNTTVKFESPEWKKFKKDAINNGKVKDIFTEVDLRKFISQKGISVVKFSTRGCVPCEKLTPFLAEYSAKGKVRIAETLMDYPPKELNITRYPTTIIFKDGKVIDRVQGIGQFDLKTKDIDIAKTRKKVSSFFDSKLG